MADNVTLNSGAGGAVLATDDIGPGVHHQLVKVEFGDPDSATQVSTSNRLPVEDAGTKAVDAVAGASDKGTPALAVRDDGLSALTPIEGDYVNLRVDANGALWTHDDVLEAALAGSELQVDIVSMPNVTVGAALPAGDNNIGNVDIVTLPALPAGSNIIGDVSLVPRTTGGLTIFQRISSADTNAANIKASAGQVYAVWCSNVNAAIRYLKFHNNAGTPTAGTGVVATVPIPGNTAGAGIVIPIPQGMAFDTGIAITLVTGAALSASTGVSADEIVVMVLYK